MSTDYYEIEYETEVECFEPNYENAHRFVKTTTKLCFIEELPDGIFESPIKKRSELLNLHRLSNNFHYAKVFFKFNYNYSDFSPDSVVIRHSDLDYSDEVTLKGKIRALYDIYYAETHGLKGCPPFINANFGIAVLGSYERRNEWEKNNEYFYFQVAMYKIYRKVEGFSTPRETITLPAAKGQGTPETEENRDFKVSKEDAKLKVKRKHKHGTGKVEEAYKIFANIRPNKGEKRKEPEPQAEVSRRQFKNWLALKNVPKEFPGINNLLKFAEWARNWESEGKRSRTVNGMSDEEMYRKREK